MTKRSIPNPFPCRGRHSVCEGPEEVLIDPEGRVRLFAFFTKLLNEALPLINGVIQFGKAIGNFATGHEEMRVIEAAIESSKQGRWAKV